MTISDRDWELLQREVDGQNPPEDSAALRERFSREPELEDQYRALQEVGRTLEQVGLVEPPEGLAHDVMRQVRQRALARPRGGALSVLFAGFMQRPALALASSLAVGVLAGVLVAGLVGQAPAGRIDERWVAGSILPSGHLGELPLIDKTVLEAPGLQATVATRQGPGVVVAELAITSPQPVDVVVELDGQALQPRAYGTPTAPAVGSVVLEADRVRIRQAGPGRYLLTLEVLRPDPAPLRIRLDSAEGSVSAEVSAATP